VVVHPKRTSGIVLYSDEESVGAALAAARKGQVVDYKVPEQPGPSGLKAAMESHKVRGLRAAKERRVVDAADMTASM